MYFNLLYSFALFTPIHYLMEKQNINKHFLTNQIKTFQVHGLSKAVTFLNVQYTFKCAVLTLTI